MSPIPEAQVTASRIPTFFIDPLARIFLGLLLFVSSLFGRVDLAVFCLVLLLLASGAKLWRRVGAGRVSCRFRADRIRVQPGERLVFAVDVENGSFLPVAVRSVLPGAGCFSGSGQGGDIRVQRVGGHQSGRLEWVLKAPGRGVYRIGPPLTETGDALGLFFLQTARDLALEIVVYPRRFPISSFPWQARELFGSLRAEGLIEDPVNTIGTREYQPGRPSRFLHWKASARLNRLQEKVFEPSRQAKVLFSVDVRGFSEAGDEEAFERILEAAASVAVHLVQGGVSVGLITNAGMQGDAPRLLPAAAGPGQLPAILERMARMTMEPAGDLVQLARYILPRTTGAGWLHFARSADGDAAAFGAYVVGRGTPISFLVARRGDQAGTESAVAETVVPLHAFLRTGGAGA